MLPREEAFLLPRRETLLGPGHGIILLPFHRLVHGLPAVHEPEGDSLAEGPVLKVEDHRRSSRKWAAPTRDTRNRRVPAHDSADTALKELVQLEIANGDAVETLMAQQRETRVAQRDGAVMASQILGMIF